MSNPKRGFSVIALDNPKCDLNIGSAMRAAGCFDSALVVIGTHRNPRFRNVTDTGSQYKHRPLIIVPNVFDALPEDCVPVAIDIIDGATPLPDYTHPERAFYIFGAEDNTLGAAITSRCRDVVVIPTDYCMNLAAAVNVVLYDRGAKEQKT